jgi:hypothetical protein
MQHDQDANEHRCQQLEFDFESKSDDLNKKSQSPHDDRWPDCGQPVDHHVLTLLQVVSSMQEQLKDIERRLTPLEKCNAEHEYQENCARIAWEVARRELPA